MVQNYLGHFVLPQELLPLLLQNHPSRVVNVSSDAHRAVTTEGLSPIVGSLQQDSRLKTDTCVTVPFFFTPPTLGTEMLVNPTTQELHVQTEETYSRLLAYACSKMCNVLHAQEIHRLHHPHISAFSLHPGVVNTGIFDDSLPSFLLPAFKWLAPMLLRTPEKGR